MIEVYKQGVPFKVTETTENLNNFWVHVFPYWEEQTYLSILPHLDKDKTFLDIGAWHGPISMVAQKHSKQCICFEPDPLAFSALKNNVESNKFQNIITVNKAVSSESSLKIGHSTELGGGVSSYLSTDKFFVDCETISIKQILDIYNLNQNNISVIKIDIEGYECELLRDPIFRELNVPMHISMHPFMFSDKDSYFNKMFDFFGNKDYINYGLDTYEIFLNRKP